MNARISSTIAASSARELFDRGLTTTGDLADTTWQERVDTLNADGYTRCQERTSRMLDDTADLLIEHVEGDLRELGDAAEHDPGRERRLLSSDVVDLVDGVGEDDLPRLLAALVRVRLDDGHDGVREGEVSEGTDADLDEMTKDELYERAREENVEGRTRTHKEELADAVRS